jgi:hypothetical protein
MPRAKQLFTERDMSRAIRAASKAGVEIDRVVVNKATGNIEVFAAKSAIPTPNNPSRKRKAEAAVKVEAGA